MDNTIYIATNTQAHVGDVAIGAAAMRHVEVQDSAGQTQRVLTTGLWIADEATQQQQTVMATVGHQWELYGCHFEVLEIEAGQGVLLKVVPLEAPCLDE
jgi:hypothetical protein